MIKYLISLLLLFSIVGAKEQFGNTSVSYFEGAYENNMIWCKVTSGATDGTLDSLVIYAWDVSSPDEVKLSFYGDEGDGTPGTVMDSTAEVTLGESGAWIPLSVIQDIRFLASTDYWLSAQSTSDGFKVKYVEGVANETRTNVITPFVTWPVSADDDAGQAVTISFYAVYTPGYETVLLPNAEGTYEVAWNCGMTDCDDLVDEWPTHDGETTIMSLAGATSDKKISLGLQNWVADAGESADAIIDSVRVVAVIQTDKQAAGNSARAFLYDGSNIEYGTLYETTELPTAYDTLVNEIIAHPTGSWSVAKIDALEVGMESDVSFHSFQKLTQINVTVYHHITAAVSGSVARVIIIQ